jgi:hypothetical protein
MIHYVSTLKLARSICVRCLTIDSSLMFLQSTITNPKILTTLQFSQLPDVTVPEHSKEQQIYRMSNDTKYRRTGAIAGLPVRVDELATAIARKVFNAAQVDLKQSIANGKCLVSTGMLSLGFFESDRNSHVNR